MMCHVSIIGESTEADPKVATLRIQKKPAWKLAVNIQLYLTRRILGIWCETTATSIPPNPRTFLLNLSYIYASLDLAVKLKLHLLIRILGTYCKTTASTTFPNKLIVEYLITIELYNCYYFKSVKLYFFYLMSWLPYYYQRKKNHK